VALTLTDSGDRDALQYYLVARLGRTKKTDLTQRMMLATWLVEFYLSKYNDLDDLIASEGVAHDVGDLKTERAILDKDLKSFFETYQVGCLLYEKHIPMVLWSDRLTWINKSSTS